MAGRKLSLTAFAAKLARDGVPFRMIQTKDGDTTIEVLTISPAAKPITDLKSEIARRISEIPSREVRPGNRR